MVKVGEFGLNSNNPVYARGLPFGDARTVVMMGAQWIARGANLDCECVQPPSRSLANHDMANDQRQVLLRAGLARLFFEHTLSYNATAEIDNPRHKMPKATQQVWKCAILIALAKQKGHFGHFVPGTSLRRHVDHDCPSSFSQIGFWRRVRSAQHFEGPLVCSKYFVVHNSARLDAWCERRLTTHVSVLDASCKPTYPCLTQLAKHAGT